MRALVLVVLSHLSVTGCCVLRGDCKCEGCTYYLAEVYCSAVYFSLASSRERHKSQPKRIHTTTHETCIFRSLPLL